MNFLAPAMLVGLLAAAIPPILHLIHRRKANLVVFPALTFIRRANKKTARRFRMRQLLLMLCRSLLLLALAFSMSRPYLSNDALDTQADPLASGTSVVVIDATWPMAYVLDGESLLDRARLMAQRVFDGSGSLSALVVAGSKVEVPMAEPTADAAPLRAHLDALKVSPHLGTVPDAVSRAFEVISGAPAVGRRRIIVLTTPAVIAAGLPNPPAGSGLEVVAVDVSRGAPLPNRAITQVDIRPAPEAGAGAWRVDARVSNLSDEPVDRLPLSLEVDGQIAVRGFASLGPGASVKKTFIFPLKANQPTPAAVVLDGDALSTDDTRAFWLVPTPEIRVLAINGDPRPTPQRDELFYLERALSTEAAGSARVRLTIVTADTLSRAPPDLFERADVVILANVSELEVERANALVSFVQGGGGLLVTMGDEVRPTLMNQRLGAVLPRALRETRAAGDAAASDEGRDRMLATLHTFDRAHPILRPFPQPNRSSLARVAVSKYMLLDPTPTPQGEVVMSLDDGAPFLLTRGVERGRVALLCGSIDRDWNDLPIRPDFVPLMHHLLRYLTRTSTLELSPSFVGQPVVIGLDEPRVTRVAIRAPDGQVLFRDRSVGDASTVSFDETFAVGLYTVEPDPPLATLPALPGFSVAVDPAGADLRGRRFGSDGRPVDPEAAQTAGTAELLTPESPTELWHAALLGLFLFLAVEAGLLFTRRGTSTVVTVRPAGD